MKIYIKYMVSLRCKLLVKEELERLGISYISVDLGVVELMEGLTAQQQKQLSEGLATLGLELLEDKKNTIIENIKNTVALF